MGVNIDKCTCCGYVADEIAFEKEYELNASLRDLNKSPLKCPRCGSYDIEPDDYDQYQDDDDYLFI